MPPVLHGPEASFLRRSCGRERERTQTAPEQMKLYMLARSRQQMLACQAGQFALGQRERNCNAKLALVCEKRAALIWGQLASVELAGRARKQVPPSKLKYYCLAKEQNE